MEKKTHVIVPMVIVSTLLCLAILFSGYYQAYLPYVTAGGLFVVLVGALCCFGAERRREKKLLVQLDAVFGQNNSASARIIRDVSIACAILDDTGRIVWRNAMYEKLFDEENILKILPQYDPRLPLAAMPLDYAGGAYQLMNMPVSRPGTSRKLTFQYWLDRTEAAHYKRLFEDQMPYVALVYVDNYEELSSDVQFHRTTVLAEVEGLIADMMRKLGGIYRRYENGRFLLVFEAARLETVEAERFPLLEAARAIDTGTNVSVSLSIAVGVADHIQQSDESARQAMELALGRGGDQAVVKVGTNYRFYGGKRQMESMQSRVKTRLFSKALRQLFENAGDVIIMGHKHADMDCVGAALGVATCAKQIGSKAYIVLDESNVSIDSVIALIQSSRAYAGMLITPEQAERLMKPTSVLVVVDTQRPNTTIAPGLLSLASRIVVIDHHRRSADHIENPTLHYLESRASSASELVTETLQYFDDNLRPPSFVCGALLAGITVDTKHFAFNVGSRTFEAAGYLRKNGADIGMVKQLFQEDMVTFSDCADAVRQATVTASGIAVSRVAAGASNAKLIAAKAADDLIGIRGVEAAFVMGLADSGTCVSGRSLGGVNVQLICERMGGGGHLTMAGAQLNTTDLDEAEAIVRSCIAQYEQEAEKK